FEELFVGEASSIGSHHFGSRITFDDKNHVFFTIGDRGVREKAQDRSNHAGSVIRLHEDGRVPKDNPFINKTNVKPEIWSYGHRNPQGLVFDRTTKILWEAEHGPRGGDEVNKVLRGANYGWPTISYGKEYSSEKAVGIGTHKKGMRQPEYQYTPSIAPCGLEIYRGEAFPEWSGALFQGSLKFTHLNVLIPNSKGELEERRLLEKLGWRVRNVRQGLDGFLYVASDRGIIARLRPDPL
ncbi:MAG: PQQ-dependent sugar dehydrogenase, partial [Pseudomonadota bacterium]